MEEDSRLMGSYLFSNKGVKLNIRAQFGVVFESFCR